MPKLSSESQLSLNSAVSRYNEDVYQIQEYLDGRGISPEAANSYLLGYVAEPFIAEHEPYNHRLCIPYITAGGVVNAKFRCIKEHECKRAGCVKYLGLPGRNNLYNVSALFDADNAVAVCEGELDALVLSVSGVPAVGIPGASAYQPHYRYIFEDYARVVVFTDGDEAGAKLGSVLQERCKAVVVRLPDGEDVNSMIIKGELQWLTSKM